MTSQMLREFADMGYLDQSFANSAYDPYYEPQANSVNDPWVCDNQYSDPWDQANDGSMYW